MLDDPDSPTIYRSSGVQPYPDPKDPNPRLPPDIVARQVTLRDRITIATLIPFSSVSQVPASLLVYLCDQLNLEIEKGDTYPMIEPMSLSQFGPYWFANFGAVMLLGDIAGVEEIVEGKDWSQECLGSFYIKPNYPGRSSHVCTGGFLVTDASRNRGVGRLMGEGYLEWAPKLGYTYSVFNLVYETNVASCRIWDALGFKRIGKVKGCGKLKSYPGQLIDAHIYGRDLGPEGEDFVSEERFDKIRFYLKHGKYPNGADRAEKSRLRSAATHYKLDGEKLMLKDKEVIGDRQLQYEIARKIHVLQHGGINKTTATIAEKYHWVRIKETVSQVIRNCVECKELAKAPVVKGDGMTGYAPGATPNNNKRTSGSAGGAAGRILALPGAQSQAMEQLQMQSPQQQQQQQQQSQQQHPQSHPQSQSPDDDVDVLMHDPHQHHHHHHHLQHHQQLHSHNHNPHQPSQHVPVAVMQGIPGMQGYRVDIPPIDPQIMEDVAHHLTQFNNSSATATNPVTQSSASTSSLPSNPTITTTQHQHQHHQQQQHTDYQALLAASAIDPTQHHHHHHPLIGDINDDDDDENMEDVSMPHHHHHHHHHLGEEDNETMAAKATAAARAAQEVMRGEGGREEGDMQRRLLLAGFGSGSQGRGEGEGEGGDGDFGVGGGGE